MTMQLFLDVDGVILDFEKGFMEHIRSTYHPELPAGYRPKTWDMDGEFADVDIEVAWDEYTISEDFTQLDLIAERDSFNELNRKYGIWLVTNLPDKLKSYRLKNLQWHGLEYRGLLLGGHHDFEISGYPKKSQIIRLFRDPLQRVVFLDDHPTNCHDVAQAFPDGKVFLMTRPHNQEVDHPFERVAHWGEFVSALEKI